MMLRRRRRFFAVQFAPRIASAIDSVASFPAEHALRNRPCLLERRIRIADEPFLLPPFHQPFSFRNINLLHVIFHAPFPSATPPRCRRLMLFRSLRKSMRVGLPPGSYPYIFQVSTSGLNW